MISLYIYSSCVLCIVLLVILRIDLYEPKDSIALYCYNLILVLIHIATIL